MADMVGCPKLMAMVAGRRQDEGAGIRLAGVAWNAFLIKTMGSTEEADSVAFFRLAAHASVGRQRGQAVRVQQEPTSSTPQWSLKGSSGSAKGPFLRSSGAQKCCVSAGGRSECQ
eukprot:jgi/Ulvmu1/12387/UM009_0033.1